MSTDDSPGTKVPVRNIRQLKSPNKPTNRPGQNPGEKHPATGETELTDETPIKYRGFGIPFPERKAY